MGYLSMEEYYKHLVLLSFSDISNILQYSHMLGNIILRHVDFVYAAFV